MDSYGAVSVDLRADVTVSGRVERADARIFLPLTGARGQLVLLTMTAGGAYALLSELERRAAELAGEPVSCGYCDGTGDRWIPIARGAVYKTTCDCRGRATL